MSALKKIRLGDLLVQNGIITQVQLDQALANQKATGRKLGRTLVELGFIPEHNLLEFLSRQQASDVITSLNAQLNGNGAGHETNEGEGLPS